MHLRLVLTTIFLLFACRNPSEEGSELKWGHLKTTQYDPAIWLISAPPNSVIEVCGEQQTHAVAGLKKWAAAIGRSAYLTFVTCDADPKATITVTVKTSSCGGTAWADPASLTVHLCSEANTIPIAQLLLHETGHLWGMCDQYQEGLSFCDTGHMSAQMPTKAVMKWYEDNLQQDDIDGLTNLVNRPDIAANKVWKDFLASQTGGTTPEDPNSPTPPGSDVPASDSSSNLYMAIEDISATATYFYISAPNSVQKVTACAGTKDECISGSAKRLTFSEFRKSAVRVIYKSQEKVSPVSGEQYTLLGLGVNDAVLSTVSLSLRGKENK